MGFSRQEYWSGVSFPFSFILSILVDSELSYKIFLYHIVNYFQPLKLDKMYLVTKLLDESYLE